MSSRGRRVAGYGEGALAGQHPDVAIGLPHVAGFHLEDDLEDGWSRWVQTTIGGSAPTWSQQAPAGHTELGVGQLATAAAANTGGVAARSTVASVYRTPAPGSTWVCKLRLTSGTTAYELWSGFASDPAAAVSVTAATQFVGVRAVGANLFGVAKDGASSESTVDLGVNCEGSNWRVVGFDVGGTPASPTLQFYVYTPTTVGSWERQPIGSPLTTKMPGTTLFPIALGLITTSAVAKTAQVDLWNLGGRVPRLT